MPFPLRTIFENFILIPLLVWIFDPTTVDLHADPIMISFTKVSMGGINTLQFYPCVHRLIYQCREPSLLSKLIYLSLSSFLWSIFWLQQTRMFIALQHFSMAVEVSVVPVILLHGYRIMVSGYSLSLFTVSWRVWLPSHVNPWLDIFKKLLFPLLYLVLYVFTPFTWITISA